MNIKRDKTYQARMDGLKYALEIVERGGIEELKKEIRVRNAHFIPLEVSAKKANEISQVLANRILATFTPTVMFSLNQEFHFGKDSHKFALEIHDMRFHACKDSDNYPDKVELKMVDGKMVWYHR